MQQARLRRYGGLAAKVPQTRNFLRDFVARDDRAADAEWLCRRVSDPLEHVCRCEPGWAVGGHAGRDSECGLHALAGAAALLRSGERDGFVARRLLICDFGESAILGRSRSDAGDGCCTDRCG